MTYTVHSFRLDDDMHPVDPGSVARGPVRTEVQLFRGRERFYTFTFTPQDNQNLALLGS